MSLPGASTATFIVDERSSGGATLVGFVAYTSVAAVRFVESSNLMAAVIAEGPNIGIRLAIGIERLGTSLRGRSHEGQENGKTEDELHV